MIAIERPAHLPRFSEPRQEPAVLTGNVDELFQIGDNVVFMYRDRTLYAPPLPARLGARLLEVRTKIAQKQQQAQMRPLTTKDIAEFLTLLNATLRVLTACVRPVGKKARLLRMLGLWRPFAKATDAEVGVLIDFLLRRRAASSIRFPLPGRN